MNYQYINGADSVAEGFRKTNENFQNVPDKASILNEANSYTDIKKTEAVNEVKEWSKEAFSNPNLLINGDFQVWQRGESFTAKGYTADRWFCNINGNLTREVNDSNVFGSKYYLKYSTSVAAMTHRITQFIENVTIAQAFGRKVTLSGYAKGHYFRLAFLSKSDFNTVNSNNGWANVEYTEISNKENWGKFSVTFDLSEIPTNNTDDWVLVIYWYSSSGEVSLANLKLELGEFATPFVNLPYGEELALCQRYYQKLNCGGSPYYSLGSDVGRGDKTLHVQKNLSIAMRTIPTVTINGSWRATTGSSHVAVNSIFSDASTNIDTLSLNCTSASSISNGSVFVLQGSNDKTANIELDAEIY